MSIAFLCVVALVTPVAADIYRGEARFNVTDPTALILLGAALICVGAWIRSYFFDRKRGL